MDARQLLVREGGCCVFWIVGRVLGPVQGCFTVVLAWLCSDIDWDVLALSAHAAMHFSGVLQATQSRL